MGTIPAIWAVCDTPYGSPLFSEMSGVPLAFLCNHTVLKGDFSVGSLAKGIFSIRADVEGIQFSRERERARTEQKRVLFS